MKKLSNLINVRAFLFILLALLLIVTVSALQHVTYRAEELGAAALYFQETPTSEGEGVSEIGSTDGIVLMGIIIVLIVVVPILLRRKSWSDE